MFLIKNFFKKNVKILLLAIISMNNFVSGLWIVH